MKDFWVFDTEDKDGEVTMLIFYNGYRYEVFYSCIEAIEFVKTLDKSDMWAVNLEYDMINMFGVENLIMSVDLLFSDSGLLLGKFAKIRFIDTLNHWKIGVKMMGETIGLKKLELDPESVEYCKRDCEITYKFVFYMLTEYEKLGIEPRITIGSTALSYFMKKYNFVKSSIIKESRLEYFRKFYHGGRTECFRIGIVKDKIHCIDINSMYPACMTNQLPNPFRFKVVKTFQIPYL